MEGEECLEEKLRIWNLDPHPPLDDERRPRPDRARQYSAAAVWIAVMVAQSGFHDTDAGARRHFRESCGVHSCAVQVAEFGCYRACEVCEPIYRRSKLFYDHAAACWARVPRPEPRISLVHMRVESARMISTTAMKNAVIAASMRSFQISLVISSTRAGATPIAAASCASFAAWERKP